MGFNGILWDLMGFYGDLMGFYGDLKFLMETNLPTPMTARVYVNLPERIGPKYLNHL